MRSVIKKSVKASGFKVKQFFDAANGKEALNILKQEWFDLVLTDFNMPEMNGLELVAAMKKDDLLRTIPVVMISTEGSRLRIEDFFKKGVAGFIKKPFEPEEIRQNLNRIMGEPDDEQQFSEDSAEGLDF